MRTSRFVVWMLSSATIVPYAGVAFGQNYPSKPVRIVTAEIGGSGDFVARLIAQGLTSGWNQQVIVDNRAGNVNILAEIVGKAPPDGYTLLVHANSFWIGPLIQKSSYDPLRDFSPVTLTNSAPNVLVVRPLLPADSVKELIALAKGKPGGFNYASGQIGTGAHLAAELFKSMAGVNIVRVPYRGNGPALVGLLTGEAQLMFPTASAVAPHLGSGKLKVLAVTSAEPSALMPGVPTVAATVPGYESVSLNGVFAPAKTPAAILNRLNQEIVRVLNTPDVKDKFLKAGVTVVGGSPAQFAAVIKSEVSRLGKVIKDAGIQPE